MNIDNIKKAVEIQEQIERIEFALKKLQNMKTECFESIDSIDSKIRLKDYSKLLKEDYEIFIDSIIKKLETEKKSLIHQIRLL